MRLLIWYFLSGEAYIPDKKSEMLRREHKSVGTLCEFLQRYSYPGALVVDMFSGTGSTAVACVLLQRRFMGCNFDEECVATCKLRLTDLFEGGSQKYDTLLNMFGTILKIRLVTIIRLDWSEARLT